MEGHSPSTTGPDSGRTHQSKPGRATYPIDHHEQHYDYDIAEANNNHSSCPHNDNHPPHPNYAHNRTCLIDTAPFDVAAFLDYLDFHDNYGDYK